MHVQKCHNFSQFWCRACTPILALSWIIGILIGVYSGISAGPFVLSLMRMAGDAHMSIVGLLVCMSLPFLISAFLLSLRIPWFVPVVAFFKACSYGFCALAIVRAFGSAGFLVKFLFLFSDTLTLPVLYWFWLRQLSCSCGSLKKDLVTALGIVAVIVLLDHLLISPFLVNIIEF